MERAEERSRDARRWTAGDLVEAAAALAALAVVVRVFGVFARAIELRSGVVLRDPVLALLTPHDMTGVIFATMYVSVAATVLSLLGHPRAFVDGLRAYTIMVLLRMVALAVTPFDAPLGTIPLHDPVIEQVATSEILTRDLFFSGHTATMFVLVFGTRSRPLRVFLVLAAAIVGVSVLVQAVHYTIDVLAAPGFAYAAYRIARATSGGARRSPWARLALPVRLVRGADAAERARSGAGPVV